MLTKYGKALHEIKHILLTKFLRKIGIKKPTWGWKSFLRTNDKHETILKSLPVKLGTKGEFPFLPLFVNTDLKVLINAIIQENEIVIIYWKEETDLSLSVDDKKNFSIC